MHSNACSLYSLLCFAAFGSTLTVGQVPATRNNPTVDYAQSQLSTQGRIPARQPEGAPQPDALVQTATEPIKQASIRWRPDMAAAREECERTGKPLLLHFYKNDCIFCEKLEQGAYQDPSLVMYIESRFVPMKVLAERNEKIAQDLRVDRFPTDVVLDVAAGSRAVILLREVCPQDPVGYASMLESALRYRDSLRAQAAAGLAATSASQPPNTPRESMPGHFETKPGFSSTLVSNSGASNEPFTPSLAHPIETSQPNSVQSPVQAEPNMQAEPNVQAEPQHHLLSDVPMMDGFCMVSLVENEKDDEKWVPGMPDISAVHLGRIYHFSSFAARQRFLENPEAYTPMMNGLDVVKFFDEGRIVEGVRLYGCQAGQSGRQRLYFFESEASCQKFEAIEQSQPFYSARAEELTRRAARDANPQR